MQLESSKSLVFDMSVFRVSRATVLGLGLIALGAITSAHAEQGPRYSGSARLSEAPAIVIADPTARFSGTSALRPAAITTQQTGPFALSAKLSAPQGTASCGPQLPLIFMNGFE